MTAQLHEECGVFGVFDVEGAANLVRMGKRAAPGNKYTFSAFAEG